MKRIVLAAAVALFGLGGFTTESQAYDRQVKYRNQYRDRYSDFRQLRAELYQLDILFSRVDAYMHYGRGRYARWEYSRLWRDRQRLDYELQRRPLDRLRIHAQIDRIRDRLRELEVRARHFPNRYYR